jgi:hypothetical protein
MTAAIARFITPEVGNLARRPCRIRFFATSWRRTSIAALRVHTVIDVAAEG